MQNTYKYKQQLQRALKGKTRLLSITHQNTSEYIHNTWNTYIIHPTATLVGDIGVLVSTETEHFMNTLT